MTVVVEKRGRIRSKRNLQGSLETKVVAPGGVRREDAIAEANRRVEAMRDTSMDAIRSLVDDLNAACVGASNDSQWTSIRKRAVQIITLSETFGITLLAEVTKRLCDFICASQERAILDPEVLAVYVKAVALSSRMRNAPASIADEMLGGLNALSSHLSVDTQQ